MMPTKTVVEGHMQKALREEIVSHKGTKRRLGELSQRLSYAQALLLEDFNWGQDCDADNLRRRAIEDIVGVGYDGASSKFRSLRLSIETYIVDKAGASGLVGQIQLCEAVLQKMKGKSSCMAGSKSKKDAVK